MKTRHDWRATLLPRECSQTTNHPIHPLTPSSPACPFLGSQCETQNTCIVWHLPSYSIKTHRRQNISFITPNNDQLNKYTSSIYYFNIHSLPTSHKAGSAQNGRSALGEGHVSLPPSGDCGRAHNPERPQFPDQGSGDRHLSFQPSPGGGSHGPGQVRRKGMTAGQRQRVPRRQRRGSPVRAGAEAENTTQRRQRSGRTPYEGREPLGIPRGQYKARATKKRIHRSPSKTDQKGFFRKERETEEVSSHGPGPAGQTETRDLDIAAPAVLAPFPHTPEAPAPEKTVATPPMAHSAVTRAARTIPSPCPPFPACLAHATPPSPPAHPSFL